MNDREEGQIVEALMEKKTHGRFLTLVAIAFAMTAIMSTTGCGKVTAENYDKIKTGMAYEEVVKILGQADKCESGLGAKSCEWGNEKKNIKVNFIAGKVVVYSKEGL